MRRVVIFLPLVAVAVVMVWMGHRPGPEDFVLSMEAEAEVTAGKESILFDPTRLGAGWSEAFEPEEFGPDELYAKINGGADHYLAHGFKNLKVFSFLQDQTGEYIELFLYDQGTQAQEMYELGRPLDAMEDQELGGYFSGASLFLVKGDYYVQIQAAMNNPVSRKAVSELGRMIVEAVAL